MSRDHSKEILEGKASKIILNPIAKEISDLLVDMVKKYITGNIRRALSLDKASETSQLAEGEARPEEDIDPVADDEKLERSRIQQLIIGMCHDLSREIPSEIIVDVIALDEIEALSNLDMTRSSNPEYSVVEEVASLSYWITKKRPISINIPNDHISRIISLGLIVGNKEEELRRRDDKIRKALAFPVNEYIAVFLGVTIIDAVRAENKEDRACEKALNRIVEVVPLIQNGDVNKDTFRILFRMI